VFHPVMAMTMTRPVVMRKVLLMQQLMLPTMTMIRDNSARNEKIENDENGVSESITPKRRRRKKREITSATSLSGVSTSLGMESTRLGGARPDDVARNSHRVTVQFCNLFGKN
jgi:hypothetical protein